MAVVKEAKLHEMPKEDSSHPFVAEHPSFDGAYAWAGAADPGAGAVLHVVRRACWARPQFSCESPKSSRPFTHKLFGRKLAKMLWRWFSRNRSWKPVAEATEAQRMAY